MSTPEEEFIKNFLYVPDKKDKWQVLSPDVDGQYKGDCEDFSLTLLWTLSGKSWLKLWLRVLTLQSMFWFCKIKGEGHVMLWHKKKGWIDNTTLVWSKAPPHKKIFPYVAPLLLLSLIIKR